jgi:cytochrome c oxidase subunit 3
MGVPFCIPILGWLGPKKLGYFCEISLIANIFALKSKQHMSNVTTASTKEAKWWNGGKSPFDVEYGKVMMWYFLMSDAFTFGAFLISYGTVRFSTNGWPDPNLVFKSFPFAPEGVNAPLVFVSIMTFILIVSSVTMVLAVHAGKMMDKKGVVKYMIWTILGVESLTS